MTSSWVASQEPRPIPRELLAVGGIRLARWVLIIIGLVVAAVYPFAVGTGATVLGGVIAINAIVVISLVLAFVATLYPSWRASRVQPAEALRYE